MQHVILVVSPDADFLQQIRSHLEEGGRYQVTSATSATEALTLANSNFYEVAILDGEIEDIPLTAFIRDLEALQSEVKILLFPPDNNSKHPLLDGLTINWFLSKPFSSPEIGKALSNFFSDQPTEIEKQVKLVDDLMKQWLEHPETGAKKADQILKATTAQTVLIIIRGQPTATAGFTNDNLITNVTGFLTRYWKEDENSELARFLSFDDGDDKFVYATKLVSNVILVLVYPHTTTIRQVRRELNRVKDDFQKNYPSTNELRQEIADRALADIQARNKALEALQPFSGAISQSELDELKLLQNLSAKNANAPTLSEEELDNLNSIIAEMPSPDPEPAVESETPSQPSTEERKMPEWLNELQQSEGTISPVAPDEGITPVQEEKPPFTTTPFLDTDSLKVPAASESATVLAAGTDQTIEVSTPANDSLPEIDFKLPWEMEDADEDIVPIANAAQASLEAPVAERLVESGLLSKEVNEKESSIGVPDEGFEALLDELTSTFNDQPPLQTDSGSVEKIVTESDQSPLPIEVVSLEKDAIGSNEPSLVTNVSSIDQAASESTYIPPLEVNESLPVVEFEQPAAIPTDAKDFRFNYTCLLIPSLKEQFLIGDLSEKISVNLPQLHLAQSWKMTSITIRPQYLLWTVSVPMSVCPHQIIHDIRSLTSAYIYANFPEIARKKTAEDFWSSNYLVVSGSVPPPVNLISDFVSQVWKNHETTTL